MTDLRALLGDQYDDTIEKAQEALDGVTTDYLGCGCCTSYDYDEAVKRTGHDVRAYMAAHDALAAVLPDLLAEAWDEGYTRGFYDRERLSPDMPGRDASEGATPNPYRCGTEGDPHE